MDITRRRLLILLARRCGRVEIHPRRHPEARPNYNKSNTGGAC